MKKISSHGKGIMVIYIYINLKQALFLYPIMKYFPNIVGIVFLKKQIGVTKLIDVFL